jgi:Tol biopolymer transport system component
MLACLEKGTVTIASMADGSVFRTFVLPRWAMNMRFLPDSSALAYVQFGVDMSDVWTIAVHGGEPRRIAHLTGELIDGYAFLPDGQGFVCSRAADLSDAFLLRLESAPSTTTTTK